MSRCLSNLFVKHSLLEVVFVSTRVSGGSVVVVVFPTFGCKSSLFSTSVFLPLGASILPVSSGGAASSAFVVGVLGSGANVAPGLDCVVVVANVL